MLKLEKPIKDSRMKSGIRHSLWLLTLICLGQSTYSSTEWQLATERNVAHPDSPWVVLAIADANLGNRYKNLKSIIGGSPKLNLHLILINKAKAINRMNLYSPFEKAAAENPIAQDLYRQLGHHIDSLRRENNNIARTAYFGHSLSGLFGAWMALQKNCPFDVVYAASPSCWVQRQRINSLGDSSVYAQTHVLVGGIERLNFVFHSSKRYAKRSQAVVFSTIPFRGHASTISRGFRDLLNILNLA